jgi:hypothetical protein
MSYLLEIANAGADAALSEKESRHLMQLELTP